MHLLLLVAKINETEATMCSTYFAFSAEHHSGTSNCLLAGKV